MKKQVLFSALISIITVTTVFAFQEVEDTSEVKIETPGDDIDRGLLSVPDSVNLTPISTFTKLITPGDLGATTKNFGCCKVFQLTNSKIYTPASESTGCPMVHMTGKGATFDLSHNCVTYNRSTVTPCGGHCIAVEVGYAPNDLGSNTQADSVTIENGIFCNWDIAILVHAGVRNVTLRNLILTNNVLPIALIGENDGDDNPVCTVHIENVSIVGNCEARLACLQWIRSKLIDGTDFGGGTASNPSGYTANEIMQLECDPEADVVDTLEIYTGLYANAVSNMHLKNVSVSNMGFDQEDPDTASQAEKSATYGMYFRDCTTLLMEQVESTKNKSGLTTVGLYLDECCLVSIKEANFSNNFVSPITGVATNEPSNTPANCRAGRWAAAVVLRDVNVIEGCDVVLSKTSGIDRTWGVRTILNPVTRSNNFGFEKVTADFLRGDRVYGFDLGDILRNDDSDEAVPAGAIHKLRMKDVSVSSARGQNDTGATGYPENEIAIEFKGIHLGDGSRDIELDGIRIESNLVLAAATGISSGVEFGALSTTGTGGDGGTGKATGTIQDLRLHDVSISGNTGGGAATGRFVGVRAVTTGTDGGLHTEAATDNIFEDITLEKVIIKNNEFDGVRVIDDSGDSTPAQLRSAIMKDVSSIASTAGHGVNIQELDGLKATGMHVSDNTGAGFEVADFATDVAIKNSVFARNNTVGITLATTTRNLQLLDVEISDTSSSGVGSVAGLIVQDLQDGHFERIIVSNTTSVGAGAASRGIQFTSSGSPVPSARNVTMKEIIVRGTTASQGDAIACEMNGAVGVEVENVNFSGAVSGTGGQAVGWLMNCLTGQGFESIHVENFKCSDQSGPIARGIYVQDPGSMTAGVRPLHAASFKNGKADNNVSSAGIAYGIDIEENSTATEVGACDVSFEKVTINKNVAVDASVAGLHIQRGESITLKEVKANNNSSILDGGTGPFTTRGIFFETSVDDIGLFDVVTSGNVANNGNCVGLQVDKATVVHADGIIANDNAAEGSGATNNNVSEVKGIYFAASVGSEQSAGCMMNNLQACGNNNARRAYGIHLQEPTGIVMQGIDASSNKSDQIGQVNSLPVLYQSIGLFLEGGCSVAMSNVHTSVNTQIEFTADNLSKSADGAPAESTTNITVDIAKHFPVLNRSGAYGILADGTAALSIDGGIASKNDGVRAFGIMLRDADNQTVLNVNASENRAQGGVWYDPDPFNGLTNTAIIMPAAQLSTIYGNPGGVSVDVKQAYEEYLKALSQFNSSAVNGGAVSLCGNSSTSVSPGSTVSSMLDIIWATLAQYRRFSTAVGIGVYNADCVTIESSRTVGNKSDLDSAAGIAIYGCGNRKGHIVQNNVSAHNQCWTDSQRGGSTFDIDGSMDISEWLPFYTFVEVGLLNSETTNACPTQDEYGFVAVPGSIVQATHITGATRKPTELTQPTCATSDTWTLNERRMTVGFPSVIPTAADETVDIYDFATVGPIAAGIMFEGQRDSAGGNNNVYGNHGHAGLGFGMLSDAASSSTYLDNRATSNGADTLGYAWGLADISYSTPNTWFKNWMYANRVDVFMNSSLLIVFDTAVSGGQSLPLQTIQPGSIDPLIRSFPLDNVIVELVNCRQIEDCIGDCVKQRLEDLSIISSANITPYPGCTTCS